MNNSVDVKDSGLEQVLSDIRKGDTQFRIKEIALDCARPLVIGALLCSIAFSISENIEQIRQAIASADVKR